MIKLNRDRPYGTTSCYRHSKLVKNYGRASCGLTWKHAADVGSFNGRKNHHHPLPADDPPQWRGAAFWPGPAKERWPCARTGLPAAARDSFTVEGALRYLNDLRDRKADWTYVRHLAERLGLELKIQVKNLSKGNKQKVGVVQALMHRPELLLLDEPTAGLDPLMQQEVLRLVAEARQAGATVFFSSHILSECRRSRPRGIIRQGAGGNGLKPALINRSLRRVFIRFTARPGGGALTLPGVSLLSRDGQRNPASGGEMDGLVKARYAFPVFI
jgi:ABC-2 type transport system ATP-binding protein